MSNYENGPGNVPRLPDRVVDTLIHSAGVSCAAPGRTLTTVRDQTANVEQLVHAACEELLARMPIPCTPAAIDMPPLMPYLRQYRHNNDDSGFVFAYEKAGTEREFALMEVRWKDAYENMRAFAEENGLDTTTYGVRAELDGATK